ncbi:hypothetical protein SISNIDRAFT_298105 [Sistotremastrum niveocremeum HHB9708]|uniref:Uncharacterized protein n=2 Tax=Sistotremastraceae TaxID=3402574 RepID=A0A164NI59_9AGAM|nr:hypothetical protein SISNIDRAFT_298105 [Sistotremastrum niveocremeum HHB9708]KZT35360.1 hypothetical protein SISSUDRAFT_173722 [Sistotremastrum suecicum HHB10207 ss-3]
MPVNVQSKKQTAGEDMSIEKRHETGAADHRAITTLKKKRATYLATNATHADHTSLKHLAGRRIKSKGHNRPRRSALQDLIESLQQQAISIGAQVHWFEFGEDHRCQWEVTGRGACASRWKSRSAHARHLVGHLLRLVRKTLQCPKCQARFDSGRIDSIKRHCKSRHRPWASKACGWGDRDLPGFIVDLAEVRQFLLYSRTSL